jgi:broad specificity phosphatase PhoE
MTSKFIWIRHAEKQYNNNKAPYGYHHHDSPIKEDCINNIYDKVDFLVKKYGFPTHIICSPFLRTRETKEHMMVKLKELDMVKGSNLNIEYDTNISEFLGFQKPVGGYADVEDETQVFFEDKITLGESLKKLNYRVKSHLENLKIYENKEDKCVWIITHGIIINNIYHNLYKMEGVKKDLKSRPKYLSYLSYQINSSDGTSSIDESDLD